MLGFSDRNNDYDFSFRKMKYSRLPKPPHRAGSPAWYAYCRTERTSPSHGEGRGFKSLPAHHKKLRTSVNRRRHNDIHRRVSFRPAEGNCGLVCNRRPTKSGSYCCRSHKGDEPRSEAEDFQNGRDCRVCTASRFCPCGPRSLAIIRNFSTELSDRGGPSSSFAVDRDHFPRRAFR